MPEEAWQREIDILREDVRRATDGVNSRMDRMLTTEGYVQMQAEKNESYNQRFKSIESRTTRIETRNETDTVERQRDRNTVRVTLIAGLFTIVSGMSIELLHLVGH